MGRNEDKIKEYLKVLDKVSPRRIDAEVFYRDCSMYVALVSLDLILEAKYSRKSGARYNPPGTYLSQACSREPKRRLRLRILSARS